MLHIIRDAITNVTVLGNMFLGISDVIVLYYCYVARRCVDLGKFQFLEFSKFPVSRIFYISNFRKVVFLNFSNY